MIKEKSNKPWIIFLIFLFAILAINVLSVWNVSPTMDENWHLKYGHLISTGDSSRPDDPHMNSTMPVSYLNYLPYQVLSRLGCDNLIKSFGSEEAIIIGRLPTIFFSILLAFYIFKWTRELYGLRPAFFALTLFTFEPNIIAHSQLITTDIYAAGMVAISTYYFWKFIENGGWKYAILSSATLGISQLTKYTCLYMYPIFILILIIKYLPVLIIYIRQKDGKGLSSLFASFGKYALFFALVSILIINAGFLFNRTFTPLKGYYFKTELLQNIQSEFPALSAIPVPLPYPYVEGIDWVKHSEETGDCFGNLYLLGNLQERGNIKGFKGYYFYAILYKMPIATQVFLLLSFLYYLFQIKKQRFLEKELFLAAPVLFFAIYFNYFYRAQIGLRHFLVVFPFLIIFCGSLVKEWDNLMPKFKVAVVLLVSYLIGSVLSYYPFYIPYFNEFVWDRKESYKILADSNISWGQGLWYFEKYREKHPEIIVNPEKPTSGRIVVSVNWLTGVMPGSPHKYKWLRDNFEPVDQIAYAYLVYDISPEMLTHALHLSSSLR